MDAIGLGDFYIIDLVKLSKPLKLIQKNNGPQSNIVKAIYTMKTKKPQQNQFFNYILMKSSSKKG